MKEILGAYSRDQKLADPHVHTNKSRDAYLAPEQIVEITVASELLHTIAITDHDKVSPSIEAFEYAQRHGYSLEVVSGSEISTLDGHLLALYIEYDIPSHQSVEQTIKEIHKQDGLAIAVHPFFKRIRSLNQQRILDVIKNDDPEIYLDGFEIFNAGVNSYPKTTAIKEAGEFYLQHKGFLGAPIGSSDNHYFTPGRGLTAYKKDLKESIKSRETAVLMLEDHESAQIRHHAINLFPKEINPLVAKLEKYRELRNKRE
ncbi:MAG: hypothetical protein ACD_50C00153G0003 [uncultured bacterium]|nr:MAG: hypothetical protein ACD_50C00153G0003 [uncultured bacterium]OGH13320.1 MAG: hypothetical protein A2687_05010 [Candidatus Levybacteria bacterium RIFCSPHIGHO2_01_FULL_38_26]